MLYRRDRNGLLLPHGTEGLRQARFVAGTATYEKIRLTVSGVTVKSLPLASACCPGGLANPYKVQSVASDVNGTFDLTTTDGCNWGFSNNAVEVRRCSPDSLVTTASQVRYFVGYCASAGTWMVQMSVFHISHGVDTQPKLFGGASAADACLPFTTSNVMLSSDTACVGPVQCDGTLAAGPFAGQPIAYGGTIDVEWLCP
jgi:hypothetical protein